MRKVVQLNSSLRGSPGTLMRSISNYLDKNQISNEMLITFGESDAKNTCKYGTDFGVKWNALKSRISGRYGFCSDSFTSALISHLEKDIPDLIQIHTIHGHDLNISRFFKYVKEREIPVVYTMHDCWAFTGYCPYYDSVNCEKWKTECSDCPLYRQYSWISDRSRQNFRDKKDALLSLRNFQIVTPSKWLKEQISDSFLKEVPCTVIPNGIDTDLFRPLQTNLKEKMGIENKKMILGVAISISEGKGKYDFIELSKKLPDDYQIVLVGVDESDHSFPDSIICKPRTTSKQELAEYYSAADVFLNPTHFDNFPTVNLESLACGTPIVTYKAGGADEAIDENTGKSVPLHDLDALSAAVMEVAEKKPEYTESCRNKAENEYGEERFAGRYLQLYRRMLSE